MKRATNHPPSVPYTVHLYPRLRSSPEEAGGYIAASLEHNIDSPESIALAFQDVVKAYNLPIEISMLEPPPKPPAPPPPEDRPSGHFKGGASHPRNL